MSFSANRSHVDERFLMVVDSTNRAGMWPLADLITVRIVASGTLSLLFAPGSNGIGTNKSLDEVDLTITAGSQKAIMKALARVMVDGGDPIVVICDDANREYVHPDILSCVITFGDGA